MLDDSKMTKIKEIRIPMPLSVDEYKIGLQYVLKQYADEAKAANELTESEEKKLSGLRLFRGHFTEANYMKRDYVFKNPSMWLKVFLPASAFEIVDESYESYPYALWKLTNKNADFRLKMEMLCVQDRGTSYNPLEWTPEELAKRGDIQTVDVAGPIDTDYYEMEYDPTRYQSTKTGRGKLTANWRQNTFPIMCAHVGLRLNLDSVIAKTAYLAKKDKIWKDIFSSIAVVNRRIFCTLDEWLPETAQENQKKK